ncbi:MAG: Holliday junction resolvase RuvX [Anaerolineae bacterium]
MTILALDVGEKRIGVAISDPTHTLARPLTVISAGAGGEAVAQLQYLVEEHQVEKVVVGYPGHLKGTVGGQARQVEAFTHSLSQKVAVPIIFWDERLSTVQAERLMIEAGTSRRERRERLDAVAAAVILQEYLDVQERE